MAYFAPYIDGTGLHMPTYEDRLSDLVTAYRSIFGIDSELSESVPDYQLLSVFAKALDDTSALVLQAYNSQNPAVCLRAGAGPVAAPVRPRPGGGGGRRDGAEADLRFPVRPRGRQPGRDPGRRFSLPVCPFMQSV